MLKLSQGRRKKQVDTAVTAPNSQNRKKPVLYAPIRLMLYSTKITLGSNAVKKRIVAIPAVIKDGHNTATIRCIRGMSFIIYLFNHLAVMTVCYQQA